MAFDLSAFTAKRPHISADIIIGVDSDRSGTSFQFDHVIGVKLSLSKVIFNAEFLVSKQKLDILEII